MKELMQDRPFDNPDRVSRSLDPYPGDAGQIMQTSKIDQEKEAAYTSSTSGKLPLVPHLTELTKPQLHLQDCT